MYNRRIMIRPWKMWICFLVAAALLTAGFGANAILSGNILKESSSFRLTEMLENRRMAILGTIETQQHALAICAESIGKSALDGQNQTEEMTGLFYDLTMAEDVALVSLDGAGTTVHGEQIDIGKSEGYARIMAGDESAVCVFSELGAEDAKFWMLHAVENGGERRAILAAAYRMDDISESLLRSAGAMNDACVLIDRSGDVLMRTERSEEWGNIMDRIADDDAQNAQSAALLGKMLADGESGSVVYTYYGEKWYCAFAELGLNDWYLAYRVNAMELEYVRGALHTYNWALYAVLLAVLIWLAAMFGLRDERILRDKRIYEQNLRASRECLRILAGHPGAILCDTDLRTNKTYLYGSFMSLFGRDPVLTNYPFDAARVGMLSDEDARSVAGVMDKARRGDERAQTDITVRNADGSMRWCRLRAYVMRDENGEPYRVISRILELNGETKPARQEIPGGSDAVQMSRIAAQNLMNEKIQTTPCALMLLDIDNSSRLADKFGNEESEKIMSRIGEELSAKANAEEQVARLGGDEFAVLIPGEMDEGALRERSAKLLSCITRIGDEFDTPLSASIGSAVSPKDGTSFDELYYKADTAQYLAKQSGRKKLLIYRED